MFERRDRLGEIAWGAGQGSRIRMGGVAASERLLGASNDVRESARQGTGPRKTPFHDALGLGAADTHSCDGFCFLIFFDFLWT